MVPILEPRPGEGTTPQQQWRTERAGAERAPVAQFLDSLKGNDATFEVVVGRSKLITTKKSIAREDGVAVIAVSDPTVLDFDVLPDSRMIRLIGTRVGITDLMFVTVEGQSYNFAVHVVYDLDLLRAHVRHAFPDAMIKLGQINEHLVVEGQARSDAQVEQILRTLQLFLASAQTKRQTTAPASRPQPGAASDGAGGPAERPGEEPAPPSEDTGDEQPEDADQGEPGVAYEEGDRPSTSATFAPAQIINLLTVPGVQQVMLKVEIAELNRTALREIGTDMFADIGNNGVLSIGGAFASTDDLSGSITDLMFSNAAGSLVGVFDSGNFAAVMRALRRNNVATILAEPNLVALDGHQARFQVGGEFPVPVAQQGSGAGNNTVQFKNFGIQLGFVPHILDDGVIRLHVEPEVSNVDESLGVTLILNGAPIPGLRTRNASTTVELREGQTLAIAGLLNREVDGNTSKIPFLGDLPYLGTLFSSTRHQVLEQELVVAVTPYLVSPMKAGERPPLPGQEIMEPKDLEFYLLGRIEGRTGQPHRATTHWDNPFHPQAQMQFEQSVFVGPIGLSD